MKYFRYISIIILTWSCCSFSQVVVIANKSVSIEKISSSELLDYYAGDIRSWKNGEPIILFDLKPKGEVKDVFYKFLGKSTSRMKSIWMKRMLLGEGDPPEALASEDEVIKKIKETPGSIGFVSADKITDEVKHLLTIEVKE